MLVSRHSSHRGFTLIELLVGITVFAIGLTAVYLLLNSTLKSVAYSRHEIAVAGILREQLELVRSVRDTNLASYANWDRALIHTHHGTLTGFTEGMFTIENNFQSATTQSAPDGTITHSPVMMRSMAFPLEGKWDMASVFQRTRLYLDEQGRYTHAPTATETQYASYLMVYPLGSGSVQVERDGRTQGYVFDARVIVQDGRTYREYDAKTVLTDWIR